MNTNLTHRDLHEEALAHVDTFVVRAGCGAERWSAESPRTPGTALHSPLVGILVGEVTGAVVEANDACLAMLGYSRDELERGLLRWTDIIPAEHRDADDASSPQFQADGAAAAWERELVRRDGSRIPVLISVATFDDGRHITVISDLSERDRAAASLRDSEQKLAQAQKMEAVGLLAGGVAHDFNNMLSVILSYSAMLTSDLEAADPMAADVQEITAAARRAADMTQRLLAFSRQQVLEPRIVDLNGTLANQERMLRRLIGEDIVLTAAYAPGLGLVMVDPGQIEQVLMNLVVNARDAMPAGGTLTIETSNVDVDAGRCAVVAGLQPGPHVLISVRDTGHGMSRQTLARIFEPFFTMKPKGQGTGLGLSSSLGIVQQSGGAMWVESALGRGSTFLVYLPITSAVAPVESPPVTGSFRVRGRETILLVEDDDRVRNAVRAILRRYGYDVLEAQNGGEALLTCEQHPDEIHAMLSDVVMPRMSGPQLAGRLRALRPDMRVVFMSGYAEGNLSVADLGGGAFIRKPFTPDTLLAGVRAVLDDHGS